MRYPKYRQWSREGVWHYWGVMSIDPYVFIPPRDPRVYNVEHPALSQQFTGLIDSESNEIFEGDVLKYTSSPGDKGRWVHVEWKQGGKSKQGAGFNIGTITTVRRVVVGNNHEGVHEL